MVPWTWILFIRTKVTKWLRKDVGDDYEMFVSVESKYFILQIQRTEVWIAGYRLRHYKHVYLFTCNKYYWDKLLQIVQVIGECDDRTRFSPTQPCRATLYTILPSWRQAFRRFLTSSVAR